MRLNFSGLGIWVALNADHLAGTLAGARIRAGALSAHGEAAAMADSPMTIDGLKAFEISLHLAAKVALDDNVQAGNCVNDFVDLLRRQFLRADIGVNIGDFENAFGVARADTVNVGQRRFDAFIAGNFYSKKTWHIIEDGWWGWSALFLFVARVFTDDAHGVFSANDLAAFANAFDGCSNFHGMICFV